MTKPILERIKEGPVVFDGAMGTMLYAKGVFINTCYDAVNLSSPMLVREIHNAYLAAGAEVIETNSFGANPIKLQRFGLNDQTREINRAAAHLARETAGEEALVAGAVGPCLRPGQMLTSDLDQQLEAAFREQIEALAEGGVDFIQLETFSNYEEIGIAAARAREVGLPVAASFAVDENGETALARHLTDLMTRLEEDPNVDIVGMNCGIGPAAMCDLAQLAIKYTSKPFVAMPNAGMPREVDGRMIYLTSPEYFTEYAKQFIAMGASGVGGCCGTTPAHIEEAARAIQPLSGPKQRVQIQTQSRERPEVEVVPVEKKSRLASRLAAGEKVSTVEILPPRSIDLSQMLEKARLCHEHGVDAINIPDGPRASCRVSPMIACLAIKEKIGIEPVLHYCCRDRNLIGMQADLMGGYAAGLANVLIITGDPPKLGNYPDTTGVFDVDSVGLTKVADGLNHGMDLGGNVVDPPTGIFIGVGANPCAIDLEKELQHYRNKIEAGAEFAITQPVFSPETLLAFIERTRQWPRRIPIIAGVWPLTSYKNAEFMNNEVPGVEVPEDVLERMRTCQTREEGRVEGVKIAQEICQAIAPHVEGFQVSAPFGRVPMALQVLGKLPLPVA